MIAHHPRPWIYVAGPYSRHPNHDTRLAVLAGEKLWRDGLYPIVPHLSHLWDQIVPHSYEHWLAFDFHLLERCDALLRLPGDSAGAEREVEFAREWGIPVYTDHDEVVAAFRGAP